MEDKHLKIISISLPVLLLTLIALTIYNADRPNENESNFRLALKMQESLPKSPASVLLASEVIEQQKHDKTKVSYIEVFHDKFSLPQEQLSSLINELENEHKEIIYQHYSSGIKISKVLELQPRYRLTLSAFLGLEPSSLKEKDLLRNNLNTETIFLLKEFAQSDDLVILLKNNKLKQENLNIENLRKIYGNSHHIQNSRKISNIND